MILYALMILFRLMLNTSMPWNFSTVGKDFMLIGMFFETFSELALLIGFLVRRERKDEKHISY